MTCIPVPRRDGVTLSEILISMMVMSVGVVSLATLFPISILRSIQATQLTNATIHRLNAEELIGLFPRLVHDPNADGNLAEHELQNMIAGVNNNGLDNPQDLDGGAVTGDGVPEGRFIVDPLGWSNPALSGLPDEFGNSAGASIDNTGATVLRRYHGGFNTPALAVEFGYLPDGWQLAAKASPTASTTTSVDAPSGTDLTAAADAIASGVRVRIILFSQNGKQSVAREHTAANPLTFAGQTISWTDPTPWAAISRFRLEIYDPRYSWLLTVRKKTSPNPAAGTNSADIDVVVFHKRPFSVTAEQIFTVDSWAGNLCILDLTTAPAGTKPFLKKGGFLFDAQHARWYRITDLKKETTASPEITLDRNVFAPLDNANNPVHPTRVMAMPGIVDVYRITPPYKEYDPYNPP